METPIEDIGEDDGDEFSENWRGDNNKSLTIKQIRMNHLNRCIVNGSVEWRGGYDEQRVMPNGSIQTKHIEDTKEIFFNSVYMLYLLLKDTIDSKEEIEKKIKDIEAIEFSQKPEDVKKLIKYHKELLGLLVTALSINNFGEEKNVVLMV